MISSASLDLFKVGDILSIINVNGKLVHEFVITSINENFHINKRFDLELGDIHVVSNTSNCDTIHVTLMSGKNQQINLDLIGLSNEVKLNKDGVTLVMHYMGWSNICILKLNEKELNFNDFIKYKLN
jgi:hypothetical protein